MKTKSKVWFVIEKRIFASSIAEALKLDKDATIVSIVSDSKKNEEQYCHQYDNQITRNV